MSSSSQVETVQQHPYDEPTRIDTDALDAWWNDLTPWRRSVAQTLAEGSGVPAFRRGREQ